ncbi:MAG: RidA family protein [Candidatus Dormibacteria bacterium]
MREVDTGLPRITPISWATISGGIVCTAHVPLLDDGSFETGASRAQLQRVFHNLEVSLAAAGGSLSDVMQVVVYLVDMGDFEILNEVWASTFAEPRPSRAVVGCCCLAVPGIGVSLTAIAHLQRPG